MIQALTASRRGGLGTLVLVVLVVSGTSLALTGALAATPAAAAASTDLSIAPESGTVTAGNSVTYEVTVGAVNNGVGSYTINVSVDDPSVARITDVSDAIGGQTQKEVDPGSARISAFGGDTDNIGSDVTIVRVTVTGEGAGNASLSLDPTSVSDEDGTQYAITSTSGASVTVEPATVESGTTLALDPTDQTVAPGESATYEVRVGAVSGGVGSYDLNVSTDDPSVARVTGVSDAIGGQTQTAIGDGSARISAFGGDTVDTGTGVTIARVTVTGEGAGSADLEIEPRSLANESGSEYAINGTSGATLTVQSSGGDGATDLSVSPTEQTITPGQSATYNITVGHVTGGVGSYTINVSIDDPSVAEITGVSNAIGGISRSATSPTEVRIGAFTGDTVDSGSDVTIVRVTVTGEGAGNASLSLDPTSVSDEDGTQYAITGTSGATVSVQEPRAPDVTGDGNRATDPDGDGLYEDVNGDGDATPGDATVLFDAVFEGDATVLDNPALFDFSGDGSVTPGDATVLFNEVF